MIMPFGFFKLYLLSSLCIRSSLACSTVVIYIKFNIGGRVWSSLTDSRNVGIAAYVALCARDGLA